MKLSMAQCKRRLAALWFIGAGAIFFLVFLQTIFGRYGEKTNEVWGWILPTVMPTLSLAIGVVVIDAIGRSVRVPRIDSFLFWLTCGLSTAYLLAVLLLFLLQPFTIVPPLQLMQQSNFWLAPFQGLVAAAMGAFFGTAASTNNSSELG
jgi:hypothetical protein